MAEHRWSKFWWQDWKSDSCLRMCSLAARGLWMDMLCICHDGEPYGHLTVNDRPVTTRQLAILAGHQEKDVAPLVAELEEAGVFSRTEAGSIYSRRMVRDAARSQEGRENVALRADRNPPPRTDVNPPTKKDDNPPTASPISHPSTQEAEAESEAESEKIPSLRSGVGGARNAKDVLWSEGREFLSRVTGKSPDSLRGALGKLISDAGGDCSIVLSAMEAAKVERPVEPLAWLRRACQQRNPGRKTDLDLMAEDLVLSSDIDASLRDAVREREEEAKRRAIQ